MERVADGFGVAVLAGALCFAAAAYAQTGKSGNAGPGAFAAVAGSEIYYEECGSSPQTVVLLHDGVLHSAAWDEVWPETSMPFATIGGYGRSPAATEGYIATDDLATLLRHLRVTHAAIIGSSHGGEISINFVLDHPEMVQQLVLVGAVVGGMPYSKHFLERGSAFDKPLEKGDVPAAIAAAVKDKFLIVSGNEAARKRMADLLAANPQDLTHANFELPVKLALPRLHEIRVPTLLVTGDGDIPDVHAHAGAIEAGIPRSRRVVLKDVGHLMYLEKPKEFSTTVIDFLERNE